MNPSEIFILIGCEESQAVCIEFRKLGFQAFSCDTLPCSGGHPEWHYEQDIFEVLNVRKWHMIIAFPPCTYISNAGAARLFPQKGKLNIERYNKGLLAKSFFLSILNQDCQFIAVENPTPSSVYNIPVCSQVIHPYQFGHSVSKRTCLWLRNLPKLLPTEMVKSGIVSYVSGGSRDSNGNKRINQGLVRNKSIRSKTFPGIAKAMAEQWGKFIFKSLFRNSFLISIFTTS